MVIAVNAQRTLEHGHLDLSERARSARGLACVLLVVFHVIGNEPTSGMRVASDSGLNFFAHLFSYIRMPLFSFLSGFVYAYRPIGKSQSGRFALHKMQRLLIPMGTAATATFVLELLRAHYVFGQPFKAMAAAAQLPSIYLYPYHQFWFIQALYADFLLLIALESVDALATLPRYCAVLGAAIAAYLLVPDQSDYFFSLPQAIYILPFFLLGIGANRYRDAFSSVATRLGILTVFLTAIGVQALIMLRDPSHEVYRRTALALAIGMTANLCIMTWLPKFGLLQFVGRYSFCIYLYHSLFLNFVRHRAQSPHLTSTWILLFLLVAAGLALPIALHRAAYRHRLARLLVLGEWSPTGLKAPGH